MNIDQQFLKYLCHSYLQKHGESLVVHTLKTVGGGCISRAFRLETNKGSLFLKFNDGNPADLFSREAESLKALVGTSNPILFFPEVILYDESGEFPPFLLTTWLEPGTVKDEAEKLGQGLAILHQNHHHAFGFSSNNYCGATLQDNSFKNTWVEFFTQNRLSHLVQLIGIYRYWSSIDQNHFEQLLVKLPVLLCHQPAPSLIHGDLWSGNLLYTLQGLALIDPCVSYSDREMELAMMTLFGGFSARVFDAYNEVYPLPEGWTYRAGLYQLYHILNHYLLFGGSYKMQALDLMKKYS